VLGSESNSLPMQLAATAAALIVVLVLAWVILKLVRRLHGGAGDLSTPQVLHSVSLGPRERLVSVRHRGREYLLGVTPSAINLIDAHVPSPVPPGTPAPPGGIPPPYGRP